ncbi:hypothetical protein J7T55_004337 [Diaporthe amygdali]|uniref:uncharacterized protein n=1 Tax=Phomopsis amygdali TaxID=1214568 RepID=UPI0022FDDFB6|nr:uncharacterized protein J7T55_004337 [Diaporthe amygdali]KAJ0109787.1 hypothetical protein J7T55_004337 [Diaporthe amygdali]
MSGRGPSLRQAIRGAQDRLFAAGDEVTNARIACAAARAALARCEEAVLRAVYRHNAERVALQALGREPMHLLVTASALMATQITAKIVSHSKSNAFLGKMKQELFKPKGLIALVITWKPKTVGSEQDASGIIDIDMSTTSASKEPPSNAPADVKRRKSMVQLPSAGTVFKLPELAPLAFPELEATTRSPEPRSPVSPGHKRPTQGEDMGSTGDYDQQKKTKSACGAGSKMIGDKEIVQRAETGCLPAFRQTTAVYVVPAVWQVKLGGKSAGSSVKRTGHFISDYQGRRAVARWSGQHPDSQMAMLAPTPEFQSKFADPNHPASSVDFRGTGDGREAYDGRGMMHVKSTAGDVGLRVGGSGIGGSEASQRFISRSSPAPEDWVPSIEQPIENNEEALVDILYLMIVNLPTEGEIVNAAACLNQVNEEGKAE